VAAKNYQRTSGALLFTFYAPATPNNCRLLPTVLSLAQALYRNHPSSMGHSHSTNTAALFRVAMNNMDCPVSRSFLFTIQKVKK